MSTIRTILSPVLLLAGIVLTPLIVTACSDDDPSGTTPTQNNAVFIKDPDKRRMIYSLVDLEGSGGRIYEMTYDVDYKLDEALNAGITGTNSLMHFVATHLFDSVPRPQTLSLAYGAGCSAFACPDAATGHYLMGRNFDFNHIDPDTKERKMIPVIVVHTAPKGGKRSVSFVDGQFVKYESGFYTNKRSDLSLLMAMPYMLLDGINEDGFAISVLKLDSLPTRQQEPGKKTIFTTVAMRMLLDRASTVDEAIRMLKDYNMCMDQDTASYHFFMADAQGQYAIVEYTPTGAGQYPTRMERLTGNDTLRCVTNFYVSPTMLHTDQGGRSLHGRTRYNQLRQSLHQHGYTLDATQAMNLLRTVAQGPDGDQGSTGFTQWSETFDLTRRSVTMTLLREWGKTFTFGIE